jgi:Na+-driven multidrug efflux pump
MTIVTLIYTIMLPLGLFLISIGAGVSTATISLFYQAKALSLDTSEHKRKLAEEIRGTIWWLALIVIIAISIGITFLSFHISNLLPAPITKP